MRLCVCVGGKISIEILADKHDTKSLSSNSKMIALRHLFILGACLAMPLVSDLIEILKGIVFNIQ